MLEFDERTTRTLENTYAGAHFSARRRFSFDVLNPGPGERIVDVGCGNGMLLPELARAVGPMGRVIGVDPSADMQAAAKARVAPFPQVELKAGTADGIPAEDESFDKSVSLQVFEYIEDIGAALSEVWRVLKPGGLFVVADLHFDSWIWAADDTARMSRMMEAWGHHAVHWDLPARLPQAMRDAGFQVDRVLPFAMVDHVMEPDGYGALLLPLLSGYAVQNGLVVEDEAEAWVAEQHMMASEGRFFFSIMQVVIAGRKPG